MPSKRRLRGHLWVIWLVHHYLFFQIPLFRPDRFLRATLPFVDWLYSRAVAWAIGGIGLIGLYLVSRQWDAFTATDLAFFHPPWPSRCTSSVWLSSKSFMNSGMPIRRRAMAVGSPPWALS